MGHLSRKSIHFVLLSLVILSVVLRYPMVDHERNQSDSYFIHSLAGDIISNEMARWTLHPMSYFGYYPLSYPSGTPFLLSESGIVTGNSLECSVLIMGIVMGVIQCLASFCLLRLFITRVEYVLLGVCLIMLSARFIDTTYWVASARGTLSVMILLTVFVFAECGKSNSPKMLLIGGLLAAASVAVHHMAVFLLLFAAAYIIVIVGHSRFGFGSRSRVLFKSAFYGAVIVSIVILSYGSSTYFRSMALSSLGNTGVFNFEPKYLSVGLNALVSYTSQIGFVFPLALLGIPSLVMRRSSSHLSLYPLAVLAIFIPLVGYTIYVSLVIAPYMIVLGVNSLRVLIARGRSVKVTATLVVLLVVSSLALPFLFIERWNGATYLSGDAVTVDPDVFNVANYGGHYYRSQYSVSNVGVLGGLVASISGASFLGSGISALLNGDVTEEDVRRELTPADTEFPASLFSLYRYDGDSLPGYFQLGLMSRGIGYLCSGVSSLDIEFAEYLRSHTHLVVYLDNNWQDSLVTTYSVNSAVFPSELRNSTSACEYVIEDHSSEFQAYMVFESERSSLYVVQLPFPSAA